MEKFQVSMLLPPLDLISTGGVSPQELLKEDPLSIDRALLVCVTGMDRYQLSSAMNINKAQEHGIIVLASLTLPFHFACLYLEQSP
jgi:hypothetical protein